MRSQEPELGKYFYCIIRSSEPREFVTRGIGEQGAIVNTIVYNDIAAVVSDSPIMEYDNSRRNLLAHTTVLEEVMQEYTILPVRFGMVAPTVQAVREQMLRRRYDELDKLLRKMDGKLELGLKAFWYDDSIYKEIVSASPQIQQLRDALVGRSTDETYYERIKLGGLVEAAMKARREEDAAMIMKILTPLAIETRTNATITERMVLNAALLVEATREPEIDQVVQRLDAEQGRRLIFKYVGSAPPYNFVNLIIRWDK